MDEVAENSDELMERYLDGEEIDHEEIVARAQAGGHRRAGSSPSPAGSRPATSAPAACSSALVEDLPSPAMRGAVAGARRRRRGDRDRARRGRAAGRLRLQDPRRPLHRADQPLPRLPRDARLRLAGRQRPRRHQKERIGQLGQPLGKDLTPVDRARRRRHRRGREAEGDPGRATSSATSQEEISFAPLDLPAPVMAFAYEPKSKGDEEKAAAAVRRLTEEDPTLDVHRDAADRRADHRRPDPDPRRGDGRADEAPLRRRDRAAPAARPLPGDDPQAGRGPRPLQEAVRRPRPVRRLQDRDRAGRGRRRARVRQQDQGRLDPRRLHPRGREGGGRGDGARDRRRLPGQGRPGAARRRQAPRRRLLRDGLQDRRLDGLQAGDGGGRPGPARADRAGSPSAAPRTSSAT